MNEYFFNAVKQIRGNTNHTASETDGVFVTDLTGISAFNACREWLTKEYQLSAGECVILRAFNKV